MKPLRRYFQRNGSLVLVALLLVCVGLISFAQKSAHTDMHQGIVFTSGKWKEVARVAKKRGKYIFVDAYTTWCGPCKLLKSKTFKDKDAAAYFNKHFINFSVDMEKGEGIKLANQWNVTAYPTLLFFNPDGKLIMRRVGYIDGDKLVDFGRQARSKN